MDVDEFLKNRIPRAKVSKLAPAWLDIKKLRAAGCSLCEVKDFLRGNNIDTSVPNLASFIKRQEVKTFAILEEKDVPGLQLALDDSSTDPLELALNAKQTGSKFDELQRNTNTPAKLDSRFNQHKGPR